MLQKNRKLWATIIGLILITSIIVIALFKAPSTLGNWSIFAYMFLVVLLILGYMKLNVDQKRWLRTAKESVIAITKKD